MPKKLNPKKSDKFYMHKALNEATKAKKKGEVPIGCVLVCNDKIIAKAHNTRESGSDPTGHAEINAIRKAAKKVGDYRLTGFEIYVTVEPCTMCLGAILQSRISRIVYGCKNPNEGAMGLLRSMKKKLAMNYKIKSKAGICADESLKYLQGFFLRLRGKRKK